MTEKSKVVKLHSTGIELRFVSGQGWSAEVKFSSLEHGNSACIEGSIGPRYFGELESVVDKAKASADAIGVQFMMNEGVQSTLYMEGDGEDKSIVLPEDWRQLLSEQCDRIGWKSVYKVKKMPEGNI